MKKGISLIILVVTIVVTVIVASSVTIAGSNALDKSRKIQFGSELLFVKQVVDTYKIKNDAYPIKETEVTLDISNLSDFDKEQFESESIVDNVLKVYELDRTRLVTLDLIYGNNEDSADFYVVSKQTGRVYYYPGIWISKNKYYTLTDDLKKNIRYEDNKKASTLDRIIFEYDNSGYAKEAINFKVKVPVEYSNVKLSIIKKTGTVIQNAFTKNNEYNEYQIQNLMENSVIEITYKKSNDENMKKQDFVISNFDNISPTFTVSEIKNVKNEITGEVYRYINITDILDNYSGIKTIKYENEKIELTNADNYFKVKGIEVDKKINAIPVKEGVTNVTIYINDNALNGSVVHVDVP